MANKKPTKGWMHKAYGRAKTEKTFVESQYQDAQDIYFPENEEFYKVQRTTIDDMDEKNKVCFNDKIPENAERYSRQVEKALFPRGQVWSQMTALDADDEKLIAYSDASERVMEYLGASNFYQEISGVINDITVGTGCIKIYPTGEKRNPIGFTHIPLASVYALVDGLHRPRTVFYLRREVDISQLEDIYGKDINAGGLVEDKYIDTINVIEVCHKMGDNEYYFGIYDEDFEQLIYSNIRKYPSFIFARHKLTNSDSIWGWGLGMKKMPLAYMLNYLTKLNTLGSSRAINPPYLYPVQPGGQDGTQAGSSNRNLKLQDGHVTPVEVSQFFTGGQFFFPMYPQSGYTIGLERIKDLEAELKQGFYINQLADQPNQDNKYRTLGELNLRDEKFLDYFSSYYNNLEKELVLEIFKSSIRILQDFTSDAIIKKVDLDDEGLKIMFVNPVVKFRKLSAVRETQQAVQVIAGTAGIEIAKGALNIEQFIDQVDDGFALKKGTFYKGEDLQESIGAIGQAKQEALSQGQAPPVEEAPLEE